ncbi:hypothetical protein Bca4012_088773 [Brassica carinata]
MGDPSMSYFCSFTYWFGVLESDCWSDIFCIHHRKSHEILEENGGQYHVLLIISDGHIKKVVLELELKLTAFISTSEMYGGVKKRETVSVAELNTYVPESPSQFSIEIINGWCYSSCAKCPRKLQPRISSFTCTTCCNTNASLCFIRYRVAMLVVAREDSAVFVAFDASMTKLTNVMAVEVANPMGLGEQRPNMIRSPSIPTEHCWKELHITSQAY